MTFTPIHAALGVTPSPFSYDMIENIVSQKVKETANIDWKRSLPRDSQSKEWRGEFAKDVAAMANSGGGVIVFGVEEDHVTTEAIQIVDVGTFSDATARDLRSIAYTAITPPVHGVMIDPVSDGKITVVVMTIPSSNDAPHLISRNQYFGAPIRVDTGTDWMKERQLEISYRERMETKMRRSSDLYELLKEAIANNGGSSDRMVITAAAQPSNPRPLSLGRVGRDTARNIFEASKSQRDDLLSEDVHSIFSWVDGMNPSSGFRRWTDYYPPLGQSSGSGVSGRIEVHYDGSVTATTSAVGGKLDGLEKPYHILAPTIEGFVADFVALVSNTSKTLGVSGAYEVALSLEWSGEEPICIRHMSSFGTRVADISESMPIHKFRTVTIEMQGDVSESGLIRFANDLALDALNQGGIHRSRYLKKPEIS